MFAPGLMIVCAGMQVELTHLGIAVIMDDLNAISVAPMDLCFPDGSENITLYHVCWLAGRSAGDG